ncbi:putative major facilitator superfamily transporter [Xylariaceae sp. FL0255]|nr:putative major facilitator superfamily transporter [Xylariaceae sp. FL0255]
MSSQRKLALVAMAFLWTGSQIPVYLFGGVPPYIYGDLGGTDRWVWFVLANLLSLAAVCPFVGSMSDLFGRRYVAITGATSIIIGMVICGTAKNMNIFIGGMVFAGIGAGINELTALAATSELAPTSKRGYYVGALIFTIIPFVPSVLWGQLIAYYTSWRYIGLLCGLWACVGLVLTVFFYYPPARVNSQGLSRAEILNRIDYVGGFLSIVGLILFLAGLLWGGYEYPWRSPHVLVPFILGFLFLVAFFVWEAKLAKWPMFPRRLNQASSILTATLVITFISGANFFSVLMFWPTQAYNVYGHNPIGVGIRGLPIGFGITAGAVGVLVLLSVCKGHNKALMIASSVLMTAGCGSLAIANVNNLYQLWGLLTIAGIGIGGIVVPASIITTIICPDDLIATVAALTLSIRVIGGSIGYAVYFNVFISKFVPILGKLVGGTLQEAGVIDKEIITEAINLTLASLISKIQELPGISGNETLYNAVVSAGQLAYAEAYKYVYYTSIAFGSISIIAALCLGDINRFMDDHVAVYM